MLIMKNEVLIVVQCRYNSIRLQGKALYPLAGIPILVFLLRRLQAGLPANTYRIVLATTELQQDNVLAAWGWEEGVAVFRGDEDDVLKRYIGCLKHFPAAAVVRVTADNPLTCPETLKRLVLEKESRDIGYVHCNNLPYGVEVDIFSPDLLKHLDREVTEPEEREHINLHILRNQDKYKTLYINIEGELARPDLRMTIDTMEDWHSIESLFSPREKEPWNIPLREAIARMDKRSVC